MICGDVFTLFERQSIGSVRGIEHSIDENAIDIEVRFDVVFGEVILRFLHLCRVIEAVIGLKREVFTFGFTCKLLDFTRLFVGFWLIRCNQLFQESIDILWRFGHSVL